MKTIIQASIVTGLLFCTHSYSLAQESASCDMTFATRHSDKAKTHIYSAEQGEPTLYFKADMDVNTDGAAKSYHPDDPRGKTLAFNNLANAISVIRDKDGNNINCSPRSGPCYTRYMDTFEAARDANYSPDAPQVETRYMIPWKMDEALGHKVPCTIQDGPNKGYFVSQTSVIMKAGADECDQSRYLDSMAINANVLPMRINWRSQGALTDKTDLVIARDMKSGRIAYAINGDRGPANKIGEGSIRLTAQLNGQELTGDETYSDIRKLALTDVEYLIFPKIDIARKMNKNFTQADIDRIGAETFAKWGGTKRLDACKALEK